MLQVKIQGAHIVLVGNFNPAIFHPSWFAAHNLLRAEEAEAAAINIVHPDVADFKTDWLAVSVVKDKLQLSTVQESYYEALRDIMVGILGLLSHTPTKFMGINREFHFDLVSEDSWNGLGHRLVPKEDWNPLIKQPGMRNLVIEGLRPDDLKGSLRVIVEPSTQIRYGIYIQVNDHFILAEDKKEIGGADRARLVLSERWNESMKRSYNIAQAIANLGEKT